MKKIVRYGLWPAFILMALSSLISCSQKPPDYYESPSLYGVVANPDRYSDKNIEVVGYLYNEGGAWFLYADEMRSRLFDPWSAVKVGTQKQLPMDCNNLWVRMKGQTLPFRGGFLEFDPARIDHISGAESGEQCYLSEALQQSKGKLIVVPTNKKNAINLE